MSYEPVKSDLIKRGPYDSDYRRAFRECLGPEAELASSLLVAMVGNPSITGGATNKVLACAALDAATTFYQEARDRGLMLSFPEEKPEP